MTANQGTAQGSVRDVRESAPGSAPEAADTEATGDTGPDGPRGAGPALTIGDLARRTGLTPAVLRTWETRYGFPVPQRLASGHRRYDERDVDLVAQVLRRRDAGVRLDAAVAEAAAATARRMPSVYAELRRRHPHLVPQTMHKSTLLALTWAMEDECCARAQSPLLFGGFQHERFFRRAERRWTELSRTAQRTVVFAARGSGGPAVDAPVTWVDLPDSAALRREWFLVCDAPDHPACLAAWEVPGQDRVPDRDRRFEGVWSLEPLLVREAAHGCAELAAAFGAADVRDDVDRLAPPTASSEDLRRATSMFSRLVGYVDGARR